jgi:hypothetical protein
VYQELSIGIAVSSVLLGERVVLGIGASGSGRIDLVLASHGCSDGKFALHSSTSPISRRLYTRYSPVRSGGLIRLVRHDLCAIVLDPTRAQLRGGSGQSDIGLRARCARPEDATSDDAASHRAGKWSSVIGRRATIIVVGTNPVVLGSLGSF